MSQTLRASFAIACAACATLTQAQSWCPPGAEWTYDYTTDVALEDGVVRLEYDGDSLIAGSTVQRLRQWVYAAPWGSSQYTGWSWGNLFTRHTDDVVEIYYPVQQQFDTIMWFAAQPGQHWTTSGLWGQVWTITVSEAYSVLVDGVSLRELVVSGNPPFWFGTDTLTERIGFHNIYPRYDNTLVIEGEARNLRCYHDDASDYSATPSIACGFTVGIMSPSIAGTISAFPNPGTDHFSLSLPPGAHVVTLYDAAGREVVQQQLSLDKASVDTRELKPGLFAYRVQDAGGAVIARGIWTKE